jgi:hypothetical protein
LTTIVTPSGLFQVPWVVGALLEPDVLVGVGEGLTVGLGLGDGDAVGDGEGLGEGDVVGAGAGADTVKLTVAVPVLPALSLARAVTLCAPSPKPARAALQLVVPDASCQAPPSTCRLTEATLVLSDAAPETVSDVPVVLPFAGDMMATVGAVASIELACLFAFGAADAGAVASSARGRARPAAVRARTEIRTVDCSRGIGTRSGSRGHRWW